MEVNREEVAESTEKKEGNLSKIEKRNKEHQEKIQQRATKVLQSLCQRFLDYLVETSDPSEAELQYQAKVLSIQWKMYCGSQNLTKEAFDMVSKYCSERIEEFNALKEGKIVPEPVAEPATPNENTVLEAAEKDPLI